MASVDRVNDNLISSLSDIYIKAGDVLNAGNASIYLNGTLTSGAKEVIIIYPISKIITANNVQVTDCKLLFRQNGKYYLGSAGVLTDALTLGIMSAIIVDGGVRLNLILNNAVDAQNNAPIAVQLTNLTLEFL